MTTITRTTTSTHPPNKLHLEASLSIQEEITTIFPPSPPASDSSEPQYTFPLPPISAEISPLAIDKGTPDAWIPRDPRLIRLTGVHPFNVEAPLTDLFDSGFITPKELFYVRNHGAVPQVQDEEIPDWEISIEGLVENPITITFKQILEEFEQYTVPITMVCAGNRRKEQNMVRKTKGFSWGAAGVSTALWTGPMLADVIRLAKPTRRAKYVCMEGADKLPNGYYGTNAKLSWVNDPNRGIMLAYKMNGEALTPDHGRPIRVVIPGQIGGRSVKWLKRMILTEGPSDNWYHIYDNRVLPTMVTPEMSSQDKSWWTDERYAIYDLSTNSAIAYPEHGETLNLTTSPKTYRTRGYAYTGGGRKISRVELSIDRGQTWSLADVSYPEDLYRALEYENITLFGGKLDGSYRDTSHCWCFWSFEINTEELANSDGLLLRAMDDSMNLQPRDMYWSVLGMMNNPWFRVAVRRDGDILHFEHPTQPALMPGGWMERVKKSGGNLTGANWGELAPNETPLPKVEEEVSTISMVNSKISRIIEFEEFKTHETAEEPWFVINNEVYNGTPYLQDHPGGATSIIAAAGTDASEEFLAIHSETAKAMMEKYHIGTLSPSAAKTLASGGAAEVDATAPIFLNPKVWIKSTLIERKVISWDTRIYTFALQHEEQVLGLPVGQHLMIRLKDQKTGDAIIRSYTPISEGDTKGKLELLVKVYFATEAPIFAGGKMTLALDALKLGEEIEVKGPIGKLEYLGRGRVMLSGKERNVKNFCMICGGSGITPIFQVLRQVVRDEGDETKCVVFDGNREEGDILCREELDEFERIGGDKCRILHTLSKPSDAWTGLRGRVGKELLLREMPPREGVLILICGPPAMEESAKKVLLEEGFKEDDMVFF
ncbi:hypothetical protein TWF102_006922 [Orbilia oligospora]|uniref:Nitrate reductase n=1 Tax=Orbilia oligospora TaxID=2813651 RepID=A0A7C8JCL3_ORBOL|nr:hypothetical protein TWF103_005794 [Orbilia oligospora]KAF3111247.1 hypothetical protein TWF102_006922 [Orbilia oligospora]KAF3114236.1 hypothetical protein TWF706_008175 [Orbilia oligospora]KAF3137157.1 hypothetical protein TWF594_007669 [Orbilia oligospora]